MASWVWACVVLGVWLTVRQSDRWVIPTLLAYGPRWIWAVPPVLLAAPGLVPSRQRFPPVALSLLLVLGPIMQFEIGPISGIHRAQPELTIVTFNAGPGPMSLASLDTVVTQTTPTVVAIQECLEPVAASLRSRNWHVDATGGLCVISRRPLVREWVLRRSGGPEAIALAHQVQMPGAPLRLVTVHLETVRVGLESVLHRDPDAVDTMRATLAAREAESRQVADRIGSNREDAIVAGDFNMPTDSALYREVWHGWTNAFEATGWGYGATKLTSWHRIRIDHVLTGSGWRVVRAATLPVPGSDHRAVAAGVVRR